MSEIEQSAARSRPRAEPWAAGLVFALIAAFSYGSIPALARVAYDGGSDPLTVAFMRYMMGTCALVMMILIFRRPILLPRKAWPLTALVTLSWFVTNVSYLAAIFYLPVGLACLLLYCFPLMAAVLLPLLDGGRLGQRQVLALLLAPLGLGLAVATVYDSLAIEGLFFALLAAASATVTLLVSRRLVVLHDVFSITVYVNLGGALVLAAALGLLGGFSFPYALSGWGGLVGASSFYAIAIVIQFAAIGLTASPQAGMASITEPLITIAVAALVLGELLAPEQFLGALLLTAALALLAWQPAQPSQVVPTTSRDEP